MALPLATAVMAQSVKVTNEPLVLPTYEIGAPDMNPIFYTGRVYQGAQGHIYPYPLYDVLTDNVVNKEYNAVYLDNEYLKVCVLPEIGGRILSATDKTNNYEIFYRQTGIKPALIGMLGAWLSGGVEWNIPHHHRPSSYMPIDWKTEENPDGSKTIWVGETVLKDRLKWSVGVTLYPGHSYVEAKVRIENRTQFIQSLLYWANVSVHCDENYEVVFPPETEFGTDHSKVYFTRWPYGEATRGSGENVRLGLWKNFTGSSRSIFAWNFEDDFLAGYDHAKHAGTVHVANRHIVGGKKFFLWGNNSSARMWDKMLSDNDGPYLELMVGAYSDNQPDYSWIGPGETREFTQRWYGIREIGAVKNANDEAAMNIEIAQPGKLFVGFNTTTKYPGSKVVVTKGDETVFEKTIDIDPTTPFTTTIKVDKKAKSTEYKAALVDANGNVLVAYQPVELEEKELPKVVEGTKPVKDYESVEELYYAGLRVEQFHNGRLDPMDFYNEALRRDSMDTRVNTVVGIRYARAGEWCKAEKHLLRALERPAKDYTRVKDPEPHYYLGVVYQAQGKYKEASDQYWKATWYPTFQHPAYYALAEINNIQGNSEKALQMVDMSLMSGAKDPKALVLKAYLLRKAGKAADAKACVAKALEFDPLDFWSIAEQSQLNGNGSTFLAAEQNQRGEGIVRVQELLEVALDYANAGAYQDASALLDQALKLGTPYTTSPLVSYYNGYFQCKMGNQAKAKELWTKAAALPVAGSFPFRLEEINILSAVQQVMPNDAMSLYYLGDLYYFLGQKEKGMDNWEAAVAKDASLAQAYRNLGFGYGRVNDTAKAIENYEKAIAQNANDPRWFQELDVLYQKSQKSAEARLAVLEKNLATTMKHDEAVMRLLTLYNETGAYDKAIAIENERHFHVWEGGGEIHEIYVDSHLLKAMDLLREGKNQEAVAEFQLADLYPDNLEVGRPETGGHSAKGFYYMGQAYKAMGNAKKAKEAFTTASTNKANRYSANALENNVFNALALKELGKVADADAAIAKVTATVNEQLGGQVSVDAYSKFGEDGTKAQRAAALYYIKGLIDCNSGNAAAGKQSLNKALELNPNHTWAKKFQTWF